MEHCAPLSVKCLRIFWECAGKMLCAITWLEITHSIGMKSSNICPNSLSFSRKCSGHQARVLQRQLREMFSTSSTWIFHRIQTSNSLITLKSQGQEFQEKPVSQQTRHLRKNLIDAKKISATGYAEAQEQQAEWPVSMPSRRRRNTSHDVAKAG